MFESVVKRSVLPTLRKPRTLRVCRIGRSPPAWDRTAGWCMLPSANLDPSGPRCATDRNMASWPGSCGGAVDGARPRRGLGARGGAVQVPMAVQMPRGRAEPTSRHLRRVVARCRADEGVPGSRVETKKHGPAVRSGEYRAAPPSIPVTRHDRHARRITTSGIGGFLLRT
jgi:hypothetical protein